MNGKQWIVIWCAGLLGVCPMAAAVEVLVPESLLGQAGLQSSWQIELPLKMTEQIDRMFVVDEYLYILTTQNFFFCLDRHSGSVRCLHALAVPGLPILRPIQFDNKSIFLIGQEIKVFDPLSGQITRTMTLSQLNGSYGSIARNTDNVYVCGSDNRLYTFAAKDGTMLNMVTADNDSPIHSVIATDKIVWFATTQGNIVAMDTWTRAKLWQFNLSGSMVSPLLAENDSIYAAGLDTKVYKLNAKNGAMMWKEPFIAGDRVKQPLILGKTGLYVFTEGTGLYSINKENGKPIWNLPYGRSVLSEKDSQSYIYASPGVLNIIDNTNGREILSIDISSINRYAVNMLDSELYLANKNGRVMAAAQIPGKKINPIKP